MWSINNVKYDSRKKNPLMVQGIRSILWQYYLPRLPKLTAMQLDKMICKNINRNLKKIEALNLQSIAI